MAPLDISFCITCYKPHLGELESCYIPHKTTANQVWNQFSHLAGHHKSLDFAAMEWRPGWWATERETGKRSISARLWLPPTTSQRQKGGIYWGWERERERGRWGGGYIMGIYMNLSESVITTSRCDGTGIMVWIGVSISHIAEIQRHWII